MVVSVIISTIIKLEGHVEEMLFGEVACQGVEVNDVALRKSCIEQGVSKLGYQPVFEGVVLPSLSPAGIYLYVGVGLIVQGYIGIVYDERRLCREVIKLFYVLYIGIKV